MRLIGDLITLGIVLVVLAAGGLIWLERIAGRPGPLAENARIEIPAGSKLRDIAKTLEERGVVESALRFELFARSRTLWRRGAGAPQAGEFDMPAGVSLAAALKRLAEGQPAVRRITVREGLVSAEIVSLLAEAGDLTGEIAEIPAEGTLMPDTYHYEKGNSRARILAMMQSEAAEALERLWPERAPDLPFDTPEEAVILASIVEKETGLAGERAEVAGVFVNRLRKGMRLQSDPTVIYAIAKDNGPLGRPLRRSDLEYDSPYNTYRHAGLPPGPIANPGRAALEAALNPMETEHLYFVADGSGGHAFARTLDEHNRNVAHWRQVQRARRIAEPSRRRRPPKPGETAPCPVSAATAFEPAARLPSAGGNTTISACRPPPARASARWTGCRSRSRFCSRTCCATKTAHRCGRRISRPWRRGAQGMR